MERVQLSTTPKTRWATSVPPVSDKGQLIGPHDVDVPTSADRAQDSAATEPHMEPIEEQQEHREMRIRDLADHVLHFEEVVRTCRQTQKQWFGELLSCIRGLGRFDSGLSRPLDPATTKAMGKLELISTAYEREFTSIVAELKAALRQDTCGAEAAPPSSAPSSSAPPPVLAPSATDAGRPQPEDDRGTQAPERSNAEGTMVLETPRARSAFREPFTPAVAAAAQTSKSCQAKPALAPGIPPLPSGLGLPIAGMQTSPEGLPLSARAAPRSGAGPPPPPLEPSSCVDEASGPRGVQRRGSVSVRFVSGSTRSFVPSRTATSPMRNTMNCALHAHELHRRVSSDSRLGMQLSCVPPPLEEQSGASAMEIILASSQRMLSPGRLPGRCPSPIAGLAAWPLTGLGGGSPTAASLAKSALASMAVDPHQLGALTGTTMSAPLGAAGAGRMSPRRLQSTNVGAHGGDLRAGLTERSPPANFPKVVMSMPANSPTRTGSSVQKVFRRPRTLSPQDPMAQAGRSPATAVAGRSHGSALLVGGGGGGGQRGGSAAIASGTAARRPSPMPCGA